jgi:hypothetical protein
VLTRFELLLLRAALTPEQVEAIDTLVGEGPRVRPAVDARARATAGNA